MCIDMLVNIPGNADYAASSPYDYMLMYPDNYLLAAAGSGVLGLAFIFADYFNSTSVPDLTQGQDPEQNRECTFSDSDAAIPRPPPRNFSQ
jgi:hypothetical protein